MGSTTLGQAVSLVQDAKLLDSLLSLLTREQAHLVKADIDAIEAIIEEKSLLLQQINIAARSRYEALRVNGFDASEAGMDAWVQRQSKQNISTAWAKFQRGLAQAKEMNRLNGVLVSKNFNRNQELLNHLQGKSADDSVYGRDGQAMSKAPNRSGLIV